RIEGEPANRLPRAALRLLALRRPAGGAEALLEYIPFAEEDHMDEVRSALSKFAMRDGKPDPAMLNGLSSSHPGVRAGAGEALARGGDAEARAAVRKLLTDDNMEVRIRAAMALAPKDAEVIPVLIEMMVKVGEQRASQIHEFLAPLAGAK